eukprot:GHVL01039458.1.p1 GENE.GHVL01039458.1~~GHVL01039458.1.p1  ORF type:complete len:971 (+),score=257.45 GHVL01039458.1:1302-4214(+)
MALKNWIERQLPSFSRPQGCGGALVSSLYIGQIETLSNSPRQSLSFDTPTEIKSMKCWEFESFPVHDKIKDLLEKAKYTAMIINRKRTVIAIDSSICDLYFTGGYFVEAASLYWNLYTNLLDMLCNWHILNLFCLSRIIICVCSLIKLEVPEGVFLRATNGMSSQAVTYLHSLILSNPTKSCKDVSCLQNGFVAGWETVTCLSIYPNDTDLLYVEENEIIELISIFASKCIDIDKDIINISSRGINVILYAKWLTELNENTYLVKRTETCQRAFKITVKFESDLAMDITFLKSDLLCNGNHFLALNCTSNKPFTVPKKCRITDNIFLEFEGHLEYDESLIVEELHMYSTYDCILSKNPSNNSMNIYMNILNMKKEKPSNKYTSSSRSKYITWNAEELDTVGDESTIHSLRAKLVTYGVCHVEERAIFHLYISFSKILCNLDLSNKIKCCASATLTDLESYKKSNQSPPPPPSQIDNISILDVYAFHIKNKTINNIDLSLIKITAHNREESITLLGKNDEIDKNEIHLRNSKKCLSRPCFDESVNLIDNPNNLLLVKPTKGISNDIRIPSVKLSNNKTSDTELANTTSDTELTNTTSDTELANKPSDIELAMDFVNEFNGESTICIPLVVRPTGCGVLSLRVNASLETSHKRIIAQKTIVAAVTVVRPVDPSYQLYPYSNHSSIRTSRILEIELQSCSPYSLNLLSASTKNDENEPMGPPTILKFWKCEEELPILNGTSFIVPVTNNKDIYNCILPPGGSYTLRKEEIFDDYKKQSNIGLSIPFCVGIEYKRDVSQIFWPAFSKNINYLIETTAFHIPKSEILDESLNNLQNSIDVSIDVKNIDKITVGEDTELLVTIQNWTGKPQEIRVNLLTLTPSGQSSPFLIHGSVMKIFILGSSKNSPLPTYHEISYIIIPCIPGECSLPSVSISCKRCIDKTTKIKSEWYIVNQTPSQQVNVLPSKNIWQRDVIA